MFSATVDKPQHSPLLQCLPLPSLVATMTGPFLHTLLETASHILVLTGSVQGARIF